MKKLWLLAPALIAIAVFAWLRWSGPSWVLRAPQPFGAAMLVPSADGDRLLFLLDREEVDQYKARGVGPGPRQVHQLRAYSVASLQPAWTTTLLREDGGHPGIDGMRLLERDGDRVWVFVREPVLVSIADGAVVPGATGWVAPPKPEAEKPKSWDEYDAIQARQSLASGSEAMRFRIAGGMFGDVWFGVLAESDVAKLAGRRFTPVLDDGDLGRSLHEARREDDRFVDPRRIGDEAFLGGGLLRTRGSVEPLHATDPDGAFLLHHEVSPGVDAWRVARADLAGQILWDVALPITAIDQLFQSGDTLLMTGPQRLPPEAHPDPHEWLIALDARDGSIRTTDLESDLPQGGQPTRSEP
jgi:hypothetical protein